MNIAITVGRGFIGSYLAKKHLNQGDYIRDLKKLSLYT
jgi:nucleoside-diphosphate-sugar epimerase